MAEQESTNLWVQLSSYIKMEHILTVLGASIAFLGRLWYRVNGTTSRLELIETIDRVTTEINSAHGVIHEKINKGFKEAAKERKKDREELTQLMIDIVGLDRRQIPRKDKFKDNDSTNSC